jgi:hypothetical protein
MEAIVRNLVKMDFHSRKLSKFIGEFFFGMQQLHLPARTG